MNVKSNIKMYISLAIIMKVMKISTDVKEATSFKRIHIGLGNFVN